MAKSDKVSKQWLEVKRRGGRVATAKDGTAPLSSHKGPYNPAPKKAIPAPPKGSPTRYAMDKTGASKMASSKNPKAQSPAQRTARKLSDKAMDYATKQGNRAIAAEERGMRVRSAVSNAKATAGVKASFAAEKGVTGNGATAKAFRTAAKVGKVAGTVGRVAGAAGAVGAAIQTGATLSDPKKLKSAATGSRAATKAAAGGYLPKSGGPSNVYASGSNQKSDAAKPVKKGKTPMKKETKRYVGKGKNKAGTTATPGFSWGRGTI